jgi:hypothetical protein
MERDKAEAAEVKFRQSARQSARQSVSAKKSVSASSAKKSASKPVSAKKSVKQLPPVQEEEEEIPDVIAKKRGTRCDTDTDFIPTPAKDCGKSNNSSYRTGRHVINKDGHCASEMARCDDRPYDIDRETGKKTYRDQ